MNRTEKIQKLEEKIKLLQATIDEIRYQPVCPVCGSDMRKSPKSDRYFCTQEHGHCGILVLNKDMGQPSHVYKSYFSTTSLVNGKVDTILRDENYFFVAYFGGGRQIEKDKYYLKG